jgi:hypothetical protein
MALIALAAKLKKDRILSANPGILSFIQQNLTTNPLRTEASDTATAKVQSRLLSSKVLATEIAAVIQDLEVALTPSPSDATPLMFGGVTTSGKGKVTRSISGHVATGSDSESGRGRDQAGWESDSATGSGQKGAHDEVPSPSAKNTQTTANRRTPGSALVAGDERKVHRADRSVSVERGGSASTPRGPCQSTFLPSLAVGYTRGDSEPSDWSDTEAHMADIQPHKNRRGQRARRAYVSPRSSLLS